MQKIKVHHENVQRLFQKLLSPINHALSTKISVFCDEHNIEKCGTLVDVAILCGNAL